MRKLKKEKKKQVVERRILYRIWNMRRALCFRAWNMGMHDVQIMRNAMCNVIECVMCVECRTWDMGCVIWEYMGVEMQDVWI